MWILFLLVLYYWYYYSNSTCKENKTRKQAVSNASSWTMYDSLFFELTNFHTNKKKQSPPYHPPSSTTTSHLSSKFLAFQLVFFCFPKKSKKLFRLKEDKTWLRMFLKLIAWISLIVTRSKGRHLRWFSCRRVSRCLLTVFFNEGSLMFCCETCGCLMPCLFDGVCRIKWMF